MFDRTTINEGSKTNIHVEQAGLHHAVKNYKEFITDAEKAVAGAQLVKFGAYNDLTAVRVKTEYIAESHESRVRILFNLNGRNYDVAHSYPAVNNQDEMLPVYRKIAQILVDALIREQR